MGLDRTRRNPFRKSFSNDAAVNGSLKVAEPRPGGAVNIIDGTGWVIDSARGLLDTTLDDPLSQELSPNVHSRPFVGVVR